MFNKRYVRSGMSLPFVLVAILVLGAAAAAFWKASEPMRQAAALEQMKTQARLDATSYTSRIKVAFLTALKDKIALTQKSQIPLTDPVYSPIAVATLPPMHTYKIIPVGEGGGSGVVFSPFVTNATVFPKLFRIEYSSVSPTQGVTSKLAEVIQVQPTSLANFSLAFYDQVGPVSFGSNTFNGQMAVIFDQQTLADWNSGTTTGGLIRVYSQGGPFVVKDFFHTNAPLFANSDPDQEALVTSSGGNSVTFEKGIVPNSTGMQTELSAIRSDLIAQATLKSPNSTGAASSEIFFRYVSDQGCQVKVVEKDEAGTVDWDSGFVAIPLGAGELVAHARGGTTRVYGVNESANAATYCGNITIVSDGEIVPLVSIQKLEVEANSSNASFWPGPGKGLNITPAMKTLTGQTLGSITSDLDMEDVSLRWDANIILTEAAAKVSLDGSLMQPGGPGLGALEMNGLWVAAGSSPFKYVDTNNGDTAGLNLVVNYPPSLQSNPPPSLARSIPTGSYEARVLSSTFQETAWSEAFDFVGVQAPMFFNEEDEAP